MQRCLVRLCTDNSARATGNGDETILHEPQRSLDSRLWMLEGGKCCAQGNNVHFHAFRVFGQWRTFLIVLAITALVWRRCNWCKSISHPFGFGTRHTEVGRGNLES